MARYNVYGLGAALVDTEIEVSDQDLTAMAVEKGLMTLVDEPRQQELLGHLAGHITTAKRASGGSAANSIIAASYFGASAYYSCKVANDENGDFYLQDLTAANVDFDSVADRAEGITGKCLVLITPDAERSMNTFLGVSETFSTAQLNPAAIAESDFLYMEGYLVTSDTGRAAAIEARTLAEQSSIKTALSFSDPGMVEFFRDGISEMLGGGVDLVFCNQDEALGWAKTESLDEAISEIKKIATTFAITLGAKGALVFDGAELHEISPHQVEAIDTNGAGDMFAGAFLYGITNGLDYKQAGDLASLASSWIVSRYGPRLPAEEHAMLLDAYHVQQKK
jgi:sugar/nucleoside kinase (ribokinase family)